MERPQIKLDGKVYMMESTAGTWRKFIKVKNALYGENFMEDEEKYSKFINFIADIFPGATPEMLYSGLDLEEVLPLFTRITEYIGNIVAIKLNEIPNAETPTEK